MLDDYRNNNLSDKSFVCLDKDFFGKPRPKGDDAKQEEDMISVKKKDPVKIDAEDLGFYQDSSDDEKEDENGNEEEKEEEKGTINLDNKFIKDDIEMMTSMYNDL